LNYIKGREDPLALPEEDYPDWLWKILDTGKKGSEKGNEEIGDEFCMYITYNSFLNFYQVLQTFYN
jgi:large subunit ribosomal protein L54